LKIDRERAVRGVNEFRHAGRVAQHARCKSANSEVRQDAPCALTFREYL
jgi:hypothetical protein